MLPIIIFEGIDKSGKSTLLAAFNKATDYKYLVLDRFLISSLVYDKAFGRDRREYYEGLSKAFAGVKDVAFLVVLCECRDNELLSSRLKVANEKLPDQLKNVDDIRFKFEAALFDKYNQHGLCEGFVKDFLVLDTGENSVDDCVQSIVNFVEKFERKADAE